MTDEEEAEANLFARCLLMPGDFILAEVKKMGGIDIENQRQVRKLARKFKVDEGMMMFRLGEVYASQ